MKKYLTILVLVMAFALLLGALGALGSAGVGAETPGTDIETPGTDTETPGTDVETPGDGENWLFKDEIFYNGDNDRSDLPMLEPGVTYTIFFDGEEVATFIATSDRCQQWSTSLGDRITYCHGYGWSFGSYGSKVESGLASVRIDKTPDGTENWLLQDVILYAENGRYLDLPAPEHGVTYTVFVNGEEMTTFCYDDDFSSSFVDFGDKDELSFGDDGEGFYWNFYCDEYVHSSCVVSVRIDG